MKRLLSALLLIAAPAFAQSNGWQEIANSWGEIQTLPGYSAMPATSGCATTELAYFLGSPAVLTCLDATYTAATKTLDVPQGKVSAANLTATGLATPGAITVTPTLTQVASITTVAGSALVDGDYFTIKYVGGTIPVEFDLSPGDGTTGGRIPLLFTAGDSADTIRDNIILLLNSAAPTKLTASSGGAATVAIVLDTPGEDASGTPNAENVTDAGFAVTGFSNPTAATTYTYKLVARLADGSTTEAGAASTTAAGHATLSAANYNALSWSAVSGAASYDVYKTVGGTTGKILSAAAVLTLNDTGLAGGGETAPTIDTTGLASVDHLRVGTSSTAGWVLTGDSNGYFTPQAASGGISGLTSGDGMSAPLMTFDMAGRVSLFRFAQGEDGYGDFGVGMGDVPGANGETRRDRFLCFGYNVSAGCARLVESDQSFHASIESNYRTSEGIRQSEFYMTFRWPDDVFPASRVFNITPHIDTPFVQVDFSSSQFNVNDVDGVTPFAQITAGGPTFGGPNAFFNSRAHRAQIHFGGLSAQRTYTAPDASGTFVLSDSNNVVQLQGGIKTGATGPYAGKVLTHKVVSADDFGTYVEYTGAGIAVVGRDAAAPTVTVAAAPGQTAATVHYTDASRQTKASVMPDGATYGTSFRVGPSAEFGNSVSIEGEPTANRTVTLPDASGTVLVGTNTEGAGAAALGTNCPAATPTAPYTWLRVTASDGTTVYVPAWK